MHKLNSLSEQSEPFVWWPLLQCMMVRSMGKRFFLWKTHSSFIALLNPLQLALSMLLHYGAKLLFQIINFRGAGVPIFKTYQFAPDIAVMIISEFEPHSRFQCMLKDMHAQSYACSN